MSLHPREQTHTETDSTDKLSYYHLKQLFVFHFYSVGLYCENLCYCIISSLICYCVRCSIISCLAISFGVVFVIFVVSPCCCSIRVLLLYSFVFWLLHPVQVPWWPSSFASRIKTKFKVFSGEI